MKISRVSWRKERGEWEFLVFDEDGDREELDGLRVIVNSQKEIAGYVETSRVQEAKILLLDQIILRIQGDIKDLSNFAADLQKIKMNLSELEIEKD